jgi:hypothetical protein
VRPGTSHERVAQLLRGTGHVVIILGPGINACSDALPSADQLAAELARRFAYDADVRRPRLPEVAEYVDLAWGKPDLYLTLQEKVGGDIAPAEVHEFLATLPAELGAPRRHQLLVTTNYDDALERALQDVNEPFDLAVYTASTGRFLHVPWRGESQAVVEPNRYYGFPIGDDLELTRTVVVKLHGVVGGRERQFRDDDFVITEDNYIEYLSGESVEQIVPFQILQILRSSHCLFLGYDIRDWNLRVFLKRVFGARVRAVSWAVSDSGDEFERLLWRECGVEVVEQPLTDYVRALRSCLQACP